MASLARKAHQDSREQEGCLDHSGWLVNEVNRAQQAPQGCPVRKAVMDQQACLVQSVLLGKQACQVQLVCLV